MRQAILSVVDYFAVFSYPPSELEVYRFLPLKTLFPKYLKEINALIEKHELMAEKINSVRHLCLPINRNFFATFRRRKEITLYKKKKIAGFISLISHLPFLRMIAFSGSVAMNNADYTDDIDLFIVTQKNKIWTTRFIVVALAQILGYRQQNIDVRLCFNLFFDEQDLVIRKEKQTLYVAHEILQMLPILSRDNTYEKFIYNNRWLKDFFPNFQEIVPGGRFFSVGEDYRKNDIFEELLKKIQLSIIKKRLTEEYISDTQLWLIQNDFETKIRKILGDSYYSIKH